MVTAYRWTISATAAAHAAREGITHDLMQAWTEALRAAREGLLDGQLPDLAVSINGKLEATVIPRRDPTGALVDAEVTASLVEVHQRATAPLIADLISRRPGTGPLRPVDSRHQPPPTLTDLRRAREARQDEEWEKELFEAINAWDPPEPDESTAAASEEIPCGRLPTRSPYDLSNPEPERRRPFWRRRNQKQ